LKLLTTAEQTIGQQGVTIADDYMMSATDTTDTSELRLWGLQILINIMNLLALY